MRVGVGVGVAVGGFGVGVAVGGTGVGVAVGGLGVGVAVGRFGTYLLEVRALRLPQPLRFETQDCPRT